jgi:uncharacterized protein YidB (DUF937 family)
MGILDSLLSGISGETSGNQNVIKNVLGLLSNGNSGGLQGIVNQLTKNGLGNIVSSWVSTGENQPVEPEQLQNALGSNLMEQFASKLGLSHSETASRLSSVLPTVIDKLTPDGKLPENDGQGNIQDLLKRFF